MFPNTEIFLDIKQNKMQFEWLTANPNAAGLLAIWEITAKENINNNK